MAVIDWGSLARHPSQWQRRFKLLIVVLIAILGVQFLLGLSSIDPLLEEQSTGEIGALGSASHVSKSSLPVDDDDHQGSNAINNHQHHPVKEDFLRSISSNAEEETAPKIHPPKEQQRDERKSKTNRREGQNSGFPCNVQSRDAISAVQRAKTNECKKQIMDTVCAIEEGSFYPAQLSSRCPRGNYTRGRSLGCFQDDPTKRLLSGFFVDQKDLNSPESCLELCLQSGFTYAGVQYGTECFCGHATPPSTAQVEASKCSKKCPRAETETPSFCGGYLTMNVFETGISKFEAQTAELIPRRGETRAKVVFLLTLNGRALRQVKRLIRALYSSTHYFYIHVDSRQDYLFRELSQLEAEFPNVRLTQRRFSSIWGGASLLQMLLSCMRELLESHGQWRWDFVINLSESDFPVKRLERLVDFLSANKGRNFVKSHGRETQRFVQKQGLDKTFVECDNHMWRVGDRVLPLGIQLDGGSDWVALDRRFVQYIIDAEDRGDALVEGLLRIFRHTLLPAESFFHTMLRNSEFCGTYVDNNLHFTNWKRKLGCKCQYRHVVDWCGCSPNDFRAEDWPRLEGTEAKQLFFARKFEPIISQTVVQRLEEWMFGEQVKNVQSYGSYWQSVYHHLDTSPRADDGLLTLGTSLVRISLRSHLHEEEIEDSLLATIKLLEVTYLMEEDRFKGFLVRAQVRDSADRVREFELLTKGSQMVQTNKKSRFAERLNFLEVSTDFDQKEQRTRNYAKGMGPFAEPVLVFQLRKARQQQENSGRGKGHHEEMPNVTAIWIDPVGAVGEVTEIALDDQPNLIYFSKMVTRTHPLQPGVWTVKLLQKGTAVGQVKFLILPLEFLNQQPITVDKAVIVNLGAENDGELGNVEDYEKHLLSTAEREELKRKAVEYSRRSGAELLRWIDGLVQSFYLVHELCVVAEVDRAVVVREEDAIVDRNEIQDPWERFERCSETSWSSMAPDPKSQILQGNGGGGQKEQELSLTGKNLDL